MLPALNKMIVGMVDDHYYFYPPRPPRNNYLNLPLLILITKIQFRQFTNFFYNINTPFAPSQFIISPKAQLNL